MIRYNTAAHIVNTTYIEYRLLFLNLTDDECLSGATQAGA